MRPPDDDPELDYTLPPWAVKLFGVFGVGAIRAQWKARAWLKRLRHARQAIGLSRGHRRMARRQVSDVALVTFFLVLVICIVYARMLLAKPGEGLLSWSSATLYEFGGFWLPALRLQPWRLGTAMLLHIGLMHLGFNLFALVQVGPALEAAIGRGRTLFLFVATGVLGFAACAAVGMHALSAGASGSLMGLIGFTAVWAHRRPDRELRDQMLKWGAYTMVFGYFVHANNVAHAGGFVAGALMALVFKPQTLHASKDGVGDRVLGVLGLVALLGFAALCLFPPSVATIEAEEAAYRDEATLASHERFRTWTEACAQLQAGRVSKAHELFGADPPAPGLNLVTVCDAMRAQRERCEAFARLGLAGVVEPREVEKLTPSSRLETERAWKMICIN